MQGVQHRLGGGSEEIYSECRRNVDELMQMKIDDMQHKSKSCCTPCKRMETGKRASVRLDGFRSTINGVKQLDLFFVDESERSLVPLPLVRNGYRASLYPSAAYLKLLVQQHKISLLADGDRARTRRQAKLSGGIGAGQAADLRHGQAGVLA